MIVRDTKQSVGGVELGLFTPEILYDSGNRVVLVGEDGMYTHRNNGNYRERGTTQQNAIKLNLVQ